MDPTLRISTAREQQHRARFDLLRSRIFEDMDRLSVRWRLAWVLPFNALVVILLAVRGESRGRVIAQAAAVSVMFALFLARVLAPERMAWGASRPAWKLASFVLGIGCYFVMVATTGGLASPLVMVGGVLIAVAGITVMKPRWARGVVFLCIMAGFVAMALLSRTLLGEVPAPLTAAGWPTAEYVTIALGASFVGMMGIHRIGCTVTHGYENAAIELAERREELCSENEDRSRALEGMAARLAHEVKNPLAAIKGLSVHMSRNAADPKTAERLAIVAAEADRLQAIVDGFLSFSRGLDDLNVAATRPHEVARELAVLLETRAEEAGVTLEVAGDVELVLDADPRKLRQAMLNLVLNAVQASPQGSKVTVGVNKVCEGARITVHDDGVGMTPEVLERIRKPYFTTKEGGTGLGVAVARGIVEQHGGRIEFKSTPGSGTTVTLTLPMKCKPCARLPNPLRKEKAAHAEEPAPAPAGVR